MPSGLSSRRARVVLITLVVGLLTIDVAIAQQTLTRFGGAYAALGERRQQLVSDWVARFVQTTGQPLEVGPFYGDLLTLSTKTTFEAVTHALMTTALTDPSGASLGDALALVERVEAVRGEVAGERGDRQFRLYVRLTSGALEALARSQQFKRGADNAVYHKGYPINYRGQGEVPSVQISVALDGRRADVDVDYRNSSFPVGLFNGHLTSSNSDVRAGNNYNRHNNRWTGFQNWWRGFFGVRQERAPEATASASPLGRFKIPRVGRKNIEVMVNDFLRAWLLEGDVVAAMGYISPRSYACLAQDAEDPLDFDRGLAPFELMANLKSAHETLGKRETLEGLLVGTRLESPALRVVRHPHQAEFVLYAVPDDVAVAFNCENRLTLGDPPRARHAYGFYFGASFYIDGRRDAPLALLWAEENGYWKIVSWRVGSDAATTPAPDPVPDTPVARISAEPALAQAARGFLESWLLRKNYDAAFGYLSPKAYGCFDLERNPQEPASTSPEDAGRRIRAGLEVSGKTLGTAPRLEAVLSAVEPVHPAIRAMDHPYARAFSLTSVPNALADAAECAARRDGFVMPHPLPLEYGDGFGMMVRFKTRSGDAPALRLLWRQENGAWRITSYGIELP